MKMTPNWEGSLRTSFCPATSRRKRGLATEVPGQVPLGEAGAFWRPVEAPPRLQHEAVDFSPPRIGNRDDSQGEIFAPHDGGRIPFGRALHRRHVRKPGQTRSCRLRGRGYLNPEVLVGS